MYKLNLALDNLQIKYTYYICIKKIWHQITYYG